MLDLLTRPYPIHGVQKLEQRALVVGGMVFALLFLFRPFGMNGLAFPVVLFDTLMYGIISAVSVYGLGRLLPLLSLNYFSEDSWTIGKEILIILAYTVFIAIGNYAYNVLRSYREFSWSAFLTMLFYTLTVAAVVSFISVLLQSNRSLKRHLHAAQTMTDGIAARSGTETPNDGPTVRIVAEVSGQDIELSPASIVCLTSDANYVVCTYLDDQSGVREHRLRNRMRAVEEQLLAYPFLFRCHRAFIINLRIVQAVEGNAKGYSLQLKAYEPLVPVARSKTKDLRELLEA